jgi:sugar lactone lactonase YvrE
MGQAKGRRLDYPYGEGIASWDEETLQFDIIADPEAGNDNITYADAEGYIWSCHWGGFCVTRYSPEGKALTPYVK